MMWRKLVPAPLGTDMLIRRNADPRNTVKDMERIARENSHQTARLAAHIQAMQGCRLENLWKGVRENVRYVPDPKKIEALRRPSRTVHDGKGDCDCMSILISSVLLNWGIPHAFRVVEVEKEEGWAHVYVVARMGGREIALDTVPEIRRFGQEHKFYNKFDHNMQTYELAGLSEASLKETRQALSDFLPQLRAAEVEDEAAKAMEIALLKGVITFLGTDQQDAALENAAQKSKILQDVYIELLDASRSEGLGSIFSKIKDKLDRLGETGIGKVFRKLRDKTLAIVDPLGIAKKAGDVLNTMAESGKATPEQAKELAENLKKEGVQDAEKKAGELIKANNIEVSDKSDKGGDKPAAAPEEKKPWYKEPWAKWAGGGLIALIILWVVYYFSRRSALSGARKRRRRTSATASKKSYSLKGISMPRPKAKAKAKKRKAAATTSKARKRRAKKK